MVLHVETVTKASELRDRFAAARRSGKTDSGLNGFVCPTRLIIDEIGHCAFDTENTRLFFDLIDRCYNKEGSFNMTSATRTRLSGVRILRKTPLCCARWTASLTMPLCLSCAVKFPREGTGNHLAEN